MFDDDNVSAVHEEDVLKLSGGGGLGGERRYGVPMRSVSPRRRLAHGLCIALRAAPRAEERRRRLVGSLFYDTRWVHDLVKEKRTEKLLYSSLNNNNNNISRQWFGRRRVRFSIRCRRPVRFPVPRDLFALRRF